jgi:hypothetical protein
VHADRTGAASIDRVFGAAVLVDDRSAGTAGLDR